MLLRAIETIYGHSIRRAFVQIGIYCGGEFHGYFTHFEPS